MAAMGGGAPGAPQKPPLTVADLAKENIEKQRKSAKAAEDRYQGAELTTAPLPRPQTALTAAP